MSDIWTTGDRIGLFCLGMIAGIIIGSGLVWLSCCQAPAWPQQQQCYLQSYGPGERRVYLCNQN